MIPGTTSLLGRIREGGSQADWKAFVARYWRVIFGYARRHGLSDADAEDFTQDVLVELTRVLPEFEYKKQHGAFRSYLRTIVRRRLIDRMRSTDHRASEFGLTNLASVEDEQWWETEWRRALLRQCLDEASSAVEPRTFQAFQLLLINEWSPKRVAGFLDLSIDSVYQARVRVSKLARKTLDRIQSEEEL